MSPFLRRRADFFGFRRRVCAAVRKSLLKAPTLALALLLACSPPRDPGVALEHARRALEQGNIDAASKEARNGYERFHDVSDEWNWKFTILRARALHWQAREDQMLSLISSLPSAAPSGDLAVQRLRLEGAAYGSLHKVDQAQQKLREADTLCAQRPYPACADVLSEWGVLAMRAGHYTEAETFFGQALARARVDGNQFLVAHSLLTLSWAADEQTRFDEALDWANAAREIAVNEGFTDTAQTAWGNMGWAYYKLGDSEKAETMFMEASNEARRLGDMTSEAGWLTNAGYAHMDMGNLSLAEASFQQSLDLARKIKSPADIMDSLTALSVVSEQTGKLEDSKRDADEALTMARADGNGRDVVYPQLVEGRIAAHRNDTATAEVDFREVVKSAETPVFLKWDAERSLARLYEDENHSDSADGEYRTALTTFEAARCDLHERVDSRLPFLTNAAHIYEDYIHFLVARGKTN